MVKHLRNIIDRIDCIILKSDARNYHFTTNEIINNHLYEDEQDIEIYPEENLLNLTDYQLSLIPIDKTATFTNTELLDRLYKIDSSKLSNTQIRALQNYYRAHSVIMDEKDVEDFLKKLKMCDLLVISDRQKNLDFVRRYHFNNNEILEILRQLQVSDYVENRKSINIGHLGDNLIIFQPSLVVIKDKTFEGLIIYLKIDIDESNGNIYVAVSFHETDKRDHRPYA